MATKNIQGLNIKSTGAVNPGTPIGSKKITLEIVLAANAVNPSVNFAPMKYGKRCGFLMCKDDGALEDYSIGYAYLFGGVIANDGLTYPGIRYTDGAGKIIPYNMTFALTTNSPRPSGEGNDYAGSWKMYKDMIDNGFDLANHSFQHSGSDKLFQVKKAERDIFDGTGFRTRTFVIPTADEGYANTCPNLGYLMVGSSFGSPARDDFEGANDSNGVYGVYWGGVLDVNTAQFGKGLLFNRWYSGEGQPGDWSDIKRVVNETFDNSSGGKNIMAHWFSHGLNDAGSNTFEYWKEVIQLIRNHPKNNDSVWIPGQNEFSEYYEVKEKCKKTLTTAANILNVELDLTSVSDRNKLRDMSLFVTGGTIVSVNAIGSDNVTFNAVTGLINVYSRNLNVSDPKNDVLPAQIISLTKNGNQVLITYDKPVTQNIFSNVRGDAYSVTGNTINSITGSGANWVVNCSSAIAVGAKMSYRMQRGNAVDVNGMKVCTYIDQAIV